MGVLKVHPIYAEEGGMAAEELVVPDVLRLSPILQPVAALPLVGQHCSAHPRRPDSSAGYLGGTAS
jgi:hypothetical protein